MSDFTQAVVLWLQSVCHNNYLVTVLISVVPMIEVRGAITVGVSLGMNPWIAYVLSCCSALLVCPILLLFLKPILRALKRTRALRFLAEAVEEMFRERAKKIDANASTEDIEETDTIELKRRKSKFNKVLGVFLFVALPLPLTGVWTGSAVAAFLDLEYRYSIPAIIVGNFVAGLIITVLNIVLGKYSSLILFVLALFVLITIVVLFVTFVVKYHRHKKSKNASPEN